ncbi:MAG TPA: thymidine kinase [Bacilli bacterium]|nr:MAG: Thymidine kinase [Tenericutes bacterium ADurb.BinA124]HNZ50049.1 thymidine kinase [Bacilli bacterium]HPN60901.1 thymidine kinase [Bacilli bacterium]HPX84183.1 thymidine kinase [Bacilli bacterium]HQC74225.1 thymidine kinase [Bacilli bacterium]
MDLQVKDGWIEVISGSMYAGKTEELIRRVKRIEYARKEVIVFKPLIDNRYSSNEVVSHDNGRTKSIDISNPEEIYQHLNGRLPYAVAIDEVQFMSSSIIDICEDLADCGVRVIVAGLDKNFRGEPFGVMPDLLARAEYVTKLDAICQVCGAPATRTQRIINGKPARYSDPIILVGAKEQYEARCRHCHVVLDKPHAKR